MENNKATTAMWRVIPRKCLGLLYTVILVTTGLSQVTGSSKSNEACDTKKCIPKQLTEAIQHGDTHSICRLMKPALNCLDSKLPICRQTIKDQKVFHVYVDQLNKLETMYAQKCKKIITSCQGIKECLNTELLNANSEGDTTTLCKQGPIAVDCVRVVLAKCEKEIGYRDANMDMLENYINGMHKRVSASCDAVSNLFGGRVLMVPLLLVLGQILVQSFNTRHGSS